MYGIIYKAVGPTGKVYIGQTNNTLAKRKAQHKFMSLKKDRRSAFQDALLNEGFDSFTWEEIDQAETAEELHRKEKQWITFYDSTSPDKGYNNQDGGMYFRHSEESRRKMSEIQKGLQAGEKHPLYGKHHSEETRRRISEARMGQVPWNKGKKGGNLSEETRRKMSEAHKKIMIPKKEAL